MGTGDGDGVVSSIVASVRCGVLLVVLEKQMYLAGTTLFKSGLPGRGCGRVREKRAESRGRAEQGQTTRN